MTRCVTIVRGSVSPSDGRGHRDRAGSPEALARLMLALPGPTGNTMDTRRTDMQDAIERLFELTRAGQTDSSEFEQLDHLVQHRLREAYAGTPPPARAAA